jgi:hypothetical protein
MEMMIGLTEFALKAMILGTRPTKRQTSCDEEPEEASEQSRRSLSKTLFALFRCRIAEDDGFEDILS